MKGLYWKSSELRPRSHLRAKVSFFLLGLRFGDINSTLHPHLGPAGGPGQTGIREKFSLQIEPRSDSGRIRREQFDLLQEIGIADAETAGRFGLVASTTNEATLDKLPLKRRDMLAQRPGFGSLCS